MRENKDATLSFRLTEQEKEQLKAIAERQDVALSKLIRNIVKEYLKAHTPKGESDITADVARFKEFAERYNKGARNE